jgi:hypothetical protein
MMRSTAALCFAALIVGAMSTSASAADVTAIQVDVQKPFKHKPSGITIAASAGGIARTAVEQFDDKQLDVAAEYRTPDGQEITTIYVFRKVTGDVPLWFDRIQREIEAREMLASPTIAIPPAAFTPPGQSNARGLVAVYAAGRPPWKSSGAAMTSTGDWFVSVRASSQTLAPQQLLGRIQQTIATIQWPREKVAAPVVVPIAQCRESLRHPSQDAKPINDDLAAILLDAAASSPDPEADRSRPRPPTYWCRDPFSLPYAGIYRPEGARDRYLVAFQDAGRGIWVGPNDMADVLAKSQGVSRTSYMVELIEIDRHVGFGSFDRLPSVAQAVWVNEHAAPKYSTSTWGKKDITISDNVVK